MLCGKRQPELALMRFNISSNRRGFKVAHFVIFYGVAHFDGSAAHFAVFDVGLAGYRCVQHHRNLFATVWAGEKVLHAGRIAVKRVRDTSATTSTLPGLVASLIPNGVV
jgi:hypothetical protein